MVGAVQGLAPLGELLHRRDRVPRVRVGADVRGLARVRPRQPLRRADAVRLRRVGHAASTSSTRRAGYDAARGRARRSRGRRRGRRRSDRGGCDRRGHARRARAPGRRAGPTTARHRRSFNLARTSSSSPRSRRPGTAGGRRAGRRGHSRARPRGRRSPGISRGGSASRACGSSTCDPRDAPGRRRPRHSGISRSRRFARRARRRPRPISASRTSAPTRRLCCAEASRAPGSSGRPPGAGSRVLSAEATGRGRSRRRSRPPGARFSSPLERAASRARPDGRLRCRSRRRRRRRPVRRRSWGRARARRGTRSRSAAAPSSRSAGAARSAVAEVDRALRRMRADGTMHRLARTWLGIDPARLRLLR